MHYRFLCYSETRCQTKMQYVTTQQLFFFVLGADDLICLPGLQFLKQPAQIFHLLVLTFKTKDRYATENSKYMIKNYG